MITRVGTVALKITEPDELICEGNVDLMHRLFDLAFPNKKSPHPLTVFRRVLDALRRDERFYVAGTILSIGRTDKQRNHVVFKRKLKEGTKNGK